MTPAARIGTATFLLAASIFAAGAAAATEAKPTPDPQLCEAFLRDLKTWRTQAISIGCALPQNELEAAAATEDNEFPPVVGDNAAAAAQTFPPVVSDAAPVSTASAAQPEFPPVVEASADPQPASAPPVVTGSSGTGGRKHASHSSDSFPPVITASADETEPDADETAEPDSLRAAIEEKLTTFKAEAKERVREAIIEKAEEVKERLKEKIQEKLDHKLGNANFHKRDRDHGGSTLRHAAKTAVKRMISEHRHGGGGGGLLHKLAQLRRR